MIYMEDLNKNKDLYEDKDIDIFGGIEEDDDAIMMDRGSRKSFFPLNINCPLPAAAFFIDPNYKDEDDQQKDKKIEIKDDEKTPEGELEQKKDDENKPKGELEQKKDDKNMPKEELEQKKIDEKKPKGEPEPKKDDEKKPIGEPEPKKNEIINNKKQSYINKYKSEDGKYNYVILFEETKNEIIISLTNEGNENDNSPFTSKYEIDYLNEKFGKNAYFKNIIHFRECLINNIEKKLLKIKSPYKNVINTVWKLFPKDYKDKKTFTLISSQSWEKNLSIIFYSNYKRAEKIVKQIEDQAQINPNIIIDKKIYKEQKYNKLIENMIFLGDKNDNDKEDKKKELLYKIIEENKEDKKKRNIDYRNIIIFFDEKKINDIIMSLVKKIMIINCL